VGYKIGALTVLDFLCLSYIVCSARISFKAQLAADAFCWFWMLKTEKQRVIVYFSWREGLPAISLWFMWNLQIKFISVAKCSVIVSVV